MSYPLRDLQLLSKMDKDVKPIFSEYEATGGIPKRDLYELLKDSDLPMERIKSFISSADQDGNEKISYAEFLEHLLRPENDVVFRKLRFGKIMLNKIVMSVDPSAGRQRMQHQMSKLSPDHVDSAYNWGEEDVKNYLEAYSCCPPPIFIFSITFLQIGIFVYYAIVNNGDDNPQNDVTAISGAPLSSPLIYDPKRRYEAWRYLTYMFIHNGHFHVGFNSVTQFGLGIPLELVHNSWRVGGVYLLGVISGSLAHSVSDPYSLLAGASGGGYALMGAHLANVIINWKEMQSGWLKSPINFISSGAFRFCLVLVSASVDTGVAIYSRFLTSDGSKIGIAAHFGGFITGLIVGIPVLRNLKVKRWEKVFFWLCIFIYSALSTLAILFNIFCVNFNKCPKVVY